MTERMYRVEALNGSQVVSTKASWGKDEAGAINGVRNQFKHDKIQYDGLRARLAKDIYDAEGVE